MKAKKKKTGKSKDLVRDEKMMVQGDMTTTLWDVGRREKGNKEAAMQ